MSYLQIVVLALIQGMAELLPVSSTAHVIVASKLMGHDPSSPHMTFLLIMLHTGTMFAVLFYFWSRWKPLLFPPPSVPEASLPKSRFHFVWMVILATAITGVLGYGLIKLIENVVLIKWLGHEKGEVEHLFKVLPLIAGALFAVGLVIMAAGLHRVGVEHKHLTARPSILIGVVQALCLPFRGFSRSGATISTGLFCGLTRSLAEDFSFALAVAITPPAIIREGYRLLKDKDWHGSSELLQLLLPGLVGMAFSFVAGLLALKFLSAVLERGRWHYFGFYCLAMAVGVLAVWQMGF
ncbi:MAG TPA: undecaprenyl-diphosphate phosphatase [Gemmataceae bacterium]|nr:undecaprenyl-diphosphate phosphatase [Gemmataceae bacterium]